MEVKEYKIEKLIAAEYNPRELTEAQFNQLRESMQRFGCVDPVIVNIHPSRKNVVIGGHQRLKVWSDLGHTAIPCIELRLTKAKERELNVRLNKNVGQWDWDVLSKEFNVKELSDWGFSDEELDGLLDIPPAKPDEASNPSKETAAGLCKKWGVKLGQLWALGDHRILCGDSTCAEDVKFCLSGIVPLLMVTDPPYGVEYDPAWRNATGISTTKRVGKVENDDRASWAAAYSLFPGDIAYVWHAGKYASTVERSLVACGFEIRRQIVWVKNRFALSRGQYHWRHEPCWYAVKKKCSSARWIGNRKQQTVWADIVDGWSSDFDMFASKVNEDTLIAFDGSMTTVWEIGTGGEVQTTHGTQKPIECMARPIRNHDSEFIYEPFSGSGTTIMACEQLRRKCRAIELSPEYVAIAIERWAVQTGGNPKVVKTK